MNYKLHNQDNDDVDVIIIGSGAAGCSAAIYAARAALNVLMISGSQPGGQLTITTDVENYPGFAEPIQGPFLMEEMQKQAANVGAKIITDNVTKLEKIDSVFKLNCDSGSVYISKAVIVATGAEAKWLGLESEKKFRGYGVSGCATCDGFFFKNEDVMVVGGGNTAAEEALFLTKHARKVYLLHRRDQLKAEKILQERIFSNNKIEPVWNGVLDEILGQGDPPSVTGARIKSAIDNSYKEIKVSGVFIAIGHKPNTDFLKDVLEIDGDGYIITKLGSTKASVEGIYAAGDVQDKIYRQAVTAAGTGCMAALDVIKFLEEK